MSETWKPVPEFPDYLVSDLGRVKSLAHVRTRKHPKTGRVQDFQYAERMLKPVVRNHGYAFVNLDNVNQVTVHRLVLHAFVGPCPIGMVACHNNGQRADNRLANLRWDTHKANSADMEAHGTRLRGEAVGTAKFSGVLVAAIREGRMGRAEAIASGISHSQFYRIKNGEARKHA